MNYILKRIKELADQEGISITALEAAIGASKGVFSRALANGTDIQSKWLVKLIENYPHYSSEWLLTGNGEIQKSAMARDTPKDYLSNNPPDLTNELIQALRQVISTQEITIRSQEATIDTLKQHIKSLEKAK